MKPPGAAEHSPSSEGAQFPFFLEFPPNCTQAAKRPQILPAFDFRVEEQLSYIYPYPFYLCFSPILPTFYQVCYLQNCCSPAEQGKKLEQENTGCGVDRQRHAG